MRRLSLAICGVCITPAMALALSCKTIEDYCAPGTPECTPVDAGLDVTTDVHEESSPPDAEASTSDALADASDDAPDTRDSSDGSDGSDGNPCNGHDLTQPPASGDACVISEELAVFVSLTGSATGAGTRTSPLASIDAAITLATAQGDAGTPKRVYACGGTYDEAIAIDASRDHVQVFGGLRCSDWSYTGERTALAPSSAGVALTLTGLTAALFVDLEIDAASAPATPPATPSAAGASSVAVLVNGATGVQMQRTKIVAGAGQPGAAGALAPYTFPTAMALRGNTADGGAGGPAKMLTCPDGSETAGGAGGSAPAGSGGPGLPALDGGAGQTSAECIVGNATVQIGANGGSGASGPGATTIGGVTSSTWTPASGLPGSAGTPGQGGGGGGAVDPGGGGSGGAGACGGAGGGAGGGGGASIAVLAIDAGLTFTAATLVTGAAGSGGAAAAGQAGQTPGGNGGSNDQTSGAGCNGGRGGSGGAGGAGGGGAGGVSVAVLYQATAPTLDATTSAAIVSGQAGLGGAGGVPGTNDGVAGMSAPVLKAP